MEEKPRIFVLGTGGTIAASITKGRAKPGDLSQDAILKHVPEIKKKASIVSSSVLRMHSADISPTAWGTIANTVFHKLPEVDGVVVTHGTDTMAYTSTVLGFMIENLNKPVVFTGAQCPPTAIGGDSRRNLINAVLVASVPEIAESVIAFGGKIIRGCRAKKTDAKSFEPYSCVGSHLLGTVEGGVKLYDHHVVPSGKKPVLHNTLETNVSLIKIHPGINPAFIENQVDCGIKGIVLEGYGWGNFPLEQKSLLPAIEYATGRNVPIVIASSCFMSRNWEESILSRIRKSQYDSDAIHVFDMLPETALVKLMWALGQTTSMGKVKKIMQKNYINEITDISTIPEPQ